MSEVKIPTPGEMQATANALGHIRELLKKGLFFGENGGYVNEAILWIDRMIANITPVVPDDASPEQLDKMEAEIAAKKAKLKVVDDAT